MSAAAERWCECVLCVLRTHYILMYIGNFESFNAPAIVRDTAILRRIRMQRRARALKVHTSATGFLVVAVRARGVLCMRIKYP